MDQTPIPFKNKLAADQDFKISRFKEKIKRTRPHKHEGYYELIYLTEGEGFHWIETEQFKIEAPELYFMQAGQLHCWQFTAIPKGYVLLFKETFFNAVEEVPILKLIQNLNRTVRIPLTQQADLDYIFTDIFSEYQQQTDFSTQIISGYLRVLFSKISQFSQSVKAQHQPSSLYERFQKLLVEKCPELRNVNDFALELNTSRQSLNTTCRKYSHQSAGAHINTQLLLEAKRYMLHTDRSINEIAEILHFNDASYFIKFFKKYEKVTPLQFRARFFQ